MSVAQSDLLNMQTLCSTFELLHNTPVLIMLLNTLLWCGQSVSATIKLMDPRCLVNSNLEARPYLVQQVIRHKLSASLDHLPVVWTLWKHLHTGGVGDTSHHDHLVSKIGQRHDSDGRIMVQDLGGAWSSQCTAHTYNQGSFSL